MEDKRYSVAELAKMAGVTERTLRYYDQIGLLVPARSNNGYRAYSIDDVHMLQRIMLLRACGIGLAEIAQALSNPDLDIATILENHRDELLEQRDLLTRSIAATDAMIERLERLRGMNDEQRFEQLKRDSVVRFEEEYGQEARKRYGDEVIDAANERMISMSKPAWEAKEELEQRIKEALVRAMKTGDVTSPEARMVAEMHAQWIRVHWGEGAYTPEAHVQLAEGYLHDPRFVEYYDSACGEGATEFLRNAIEANIPTA